VRKNTKGCPSARSPHDDRTGIEGCQTRSVPAMKNDVACRRTAVEPKREPRRGSDDDRASWSRAPDRLVRHHGLSLQAAPPEIDDGNTPRPDDVEAHDRNRTSTGKRRRVSARKPLAKTPGHLVRSQRMPAETAIRPPWNPTSAKKADRNALREVLCWGPAPRSDEIGPNSRNRC